jgi:hypothetical protein
MPYGNINVDTVTTSTPQGILGAGNASIMKNRIINGAMVIDQRNAGASVTPNVLNYPVDRTFGFSEVTGKFSCQQNSGSVTPPNGFKNYLGAVSLSAYSVPSAEQYILGQVIEGFNVADLGWGTANAQTVTLSFWVRSSLTGTFGGSLQNGAYNRSYPFSYTINSANTWEYKTITIAGDTTGTWLTTNGAGIRLSFSLGAGSTMSGTAGAWAAANYISATGATSVVGTNGATFYITGVQLEVGSSATGFEYRQYGQELALCQRYFVNMGGITGAADSVMGTGFKNTGNQVRFNLQTPVTLRATPSISITGSIYALGNASNNICTGSASGIVPTNPNGFGFLITTTATLTDNVLYGMYTANVNNYISVSAEL